MPGAYFVKRLVQITSPPFSDVFEALSDPFRGVSPGSDVEELLIGFGILHDCFGLAVDSKNNRLLTSLKALHEFPGVTPESGHRLDVFGDVKSHVIPLTKAPLKVSYRRPGGKGQKRETANFALVSTFSFP
jgi:hypothetical protein